jgi:tetratricopeptide (TPR) repeat protein
MVRRLLSVSLLSLPMALVACAPGGGAPSGAAPQARPVQVLVEDLPAERARLERDRDRDPNSADVRVALGEVYYRSARDALDRNHDEERYLHFLALSVDQFVVAVEIDPRDGRPHFYLAMMDAYQGDIKKALRGFDNARRLTPSGVAYTNIAEIFVYMDRIEKAHRWNDMGLKRGAPHSAVLFNEMLIAWKEGDLREAESIFGRLRQHYPEAISTINVARLPAPPRRFEEFAGYCCGSPACGPYMKEQCYSLDLTVQEQELSEAAVLKQLRIEIEKTRRLKEVYRQRKELEVEIEGAP